MNHVTAIWTAFAVACAGWVSTGGGHPPAVILVPYVFAIWLAGAVASELVARWRDPRRSLVKSLVFLVLATPLFFGAAVSGLVVKDYPRSLEMELEMLVWHIGFGPVLLIATVAILALLSRRWR